MRGFSAFVIVEVVDCHIAGVEPSGRESKAEPLDFIGCGGPQRSECSQVAVSATVGGNRLSHWF